MGMTLIAVTQEELCDLMCGGPEDELEEGEDEGADIIYSSEDGVVTEKGADATGSTGSSKNRA